MEFLNLHRMRILLILLVILVYGRNSIAQETLQLYEQEIKAGILYNFIKYTDWPPESFKSNKLNLCIYGNDPFENYLKQLRGRSVNQKEIAVLNTRSIKDISSCHVLFVSNDKMINWSGLKDFLANKHILTISDFQGFIYSGGMIEFARINNRISVKLNMEPLNKADLHINDRMLKLVNVVNTDAGEGW